MRHGKLTREQAIKIAGQEVVEQLDHENCDFTGRLQTDGDESVEFAASVEYFNSDNERCTLIAYYYQMPEDLVGKEDLDQLDWEIEGYEIN